MSAPSSLAAVLDTNVLFPPTLRDMLLYAADLGLFRLFWSAEILEELRRSLVEEAGLAAEMADRRVRWMADAFPDAMVPVDPEKAASLPNHPKDRHVMAVAVEAGAGVIVTENLKDFPNEALAPYGIAACSADTFLSDLLRESPEEMLEALRFHANLLRHPPMMRISAMSTMRFGDADHAFR